MTILAGILSLGNIAFEPTESDALKVSETSRGWLKATAVSWLEWIKNKNGAFIGGKNPLFWCDAAVMSPP